MFKQYFLLVLISQMALEMFQLTGALGRNMFVAKTCGGEEIVDMEYWASLLMYALNVIAVNEFIGNG